MSIVDNIIKNSAPPVQQQPNFFNKNIINPVKNAFSGGVQQVKQGVSDAANAKNPGQFIHSIGELGSGAAGAITSPLAPIMQPASDVISATGNKIAENPNVQNFANSKAGQVTSNIAENVQNFANIAGTVGGGMEAYKLATDHPIFTRTTPVFAAEAARTAAGTEGVSALNAATEKVAQGKIDLGTNFAQGAKTIADTNPNLKLTLTNSQIDALNNLKESKSFSLPENLSQENNPALNTGSKFGNIKLSPKNLEQINALDNTGKVQLNPVEAQDLIKRLNKLTFDAKASGDLKVNQQSIGLTNEIKSAANETFKGTGWDKVYENYSKGIQATHAINDIVNINPEATATDMHGALQKAINLTKTPEGKLQLQQAIEEYKKATVSPQNPEGIDLNDLPKATQQILDKQFALEQAQKPGFMKQVFNPTYLGRAAVRYGLIYLGLKGIVNALKSQ